MRLKTTKMFLVLAAAALTVSACGGSDSKDEGSAGPTTGAGGGGEATESYLFYGTGSDLSAVDSANPASPITVESENVLQGDSIVDNGDSVFVFGTYDATSKTLSDLHGHAIVYAKANGKLYKVNAMKSGGVPVPVQLSSESAADKICQVVQHATDFSNPNNSQYVYRISGGNSVCNDSDDVYKMVRLGMGTTDAPILAKEPVAALRNWSTTGLISGWLVNDAGALKRCDANFSNCGASLKSLLNGGVYPYGVSGASDLGDGSNRVLLEIVDSLDASHYVYDDNAKTLSAPVSDLSYLGNDTNKLYFVGDGTGKKGIYSAPIDGSAAATLLVAESVDIFDLRITSNKLVYTTNTATRTELKAVAKTGVAPTTLETSEGLMSIEIDAVNGDHVFYTVFKAGVPAAGVVDSDLTNKSVTPAAMWIGHAIAPSSSFARTHEYIFPTTIIRVEGYDALGTGKGFADGTLRSFDTASKAQVAVLGTVPSDINRMNCGYGNGEFEPNLLCEGSALGQIDIFFVNAETSNSLVRVTNTPAKYEYSY